MPIFSSTPARITEPAVGASTWASGSQVWNGNIGTLIAKASAKARNSQHLRRARAERGSHAGRRRSKRRSCRSLAPGSTARGCATSISTLPTIV